MNILKVVPATAALVALVIALLPAGEAPSTVRIAVSGMTCEGCASNIGKALDGLEGVEKSSIDIAEGYADVVFASAKVSAGDIVRAIEGAGYAASEMDAARPARGGDGPAVQQKSGAPPPNPGLDDIRARLAKAKNGLMRDGKYSCCISPSCDFCAIAANGCVCGENLAKGKPVCGECKGGWTAGYGMNPDIDPKDVKALSDAEMKAMYKSRSELIKNSKSPGEKKE